MMNETKYDISQLTQAAVYLLLINTMLLQTWKKFIFVRKPIFRAEKCLLIHIVPMHIKVPEIAIFSCEATLDNTQNVPLLHLET